MHTKRYGSYTCEPTAVTHVNCFFGFLNTCVTCKSALSTGAVDWRHTACVMLKKQSGTG